MKTVVEAILMIQENEGIPYHIILLSRNINFLISITNVTQKWSTDGIAGFLRLYDTGKPYILPLF
jgi:hypothetical protein